MSVFTGVFINEQLTCNEMSLCCYLSTACTKASTDSPLLHLTMAGLPFTMADCGTCSNNEIEISVLKPKCK